MSQDSPTRLSTASPEEALREAVSLGMWMRALQRQRDAGASAAHIQAAEIAFDNAVRFALSLQPVAEAPSPVPPGRLC